MQGVYYFSDKSISQCRSFEVSTSHFYILDHICVFTLVVNPTKSSLHTPLTEI